MLAQLCRKPVVTVSPGSTIGAAAREMRDRNVGAVVVAEGTRAVGILTDRDIVVKVIGTGRDPGTVTVDAVMTRDLTTIHADHGIFDAVKLLGSSGVRRLPVVSKSGELVGIVSLDDVLMLLGREMGQICSVVARALGRPEASPYAY